MSDVAIYTDLLLPKAWVRRCSVLVPIDSAMASHVNLRQHRRDVDRHTVNAGHVKDVVRKTMLTAGMMGPAIKKTTRQYLTDYDDKIKEDI